MSFYTEIKVFRWELLKGKGGGHYCGGVTADSGYSHGLPAGSPGPQEGRVSEWTTADQIGTTHHTPGPQ